MNTIVSNWSRSETANPQHLWKPADTEQTINIVHEARTRGEKIRVIGAGHSFTPVAMSQGHLVNLDRISGVKSVDSATQRVRFYAGTRLRDIPKLLKPYGLALPNQGDVDPQSIAGALSTGTHGTGLGFTGFGGCTTGLTLLTADGQVRELSADQDPEIFDLARVSLGVLGILLEVELQCVDAFDLVAVETGVDLETILDSVIELAREADHVEFFWFPHTDRVMFKSNTRLAPGQPLPEGLPEVNNRGKLGRMLTEELVDNGVYQVICELGRHVPKLVQPLNKLSTALISNRAYRAPAHEVFVSPRRVKFNEMEYAVPLEQGPEAVREVRDLINDKGWQIGFPLEVRVAAADDVPLSTGYNRENMYISVHRYAKEDHTEYFHAVEEIMKAHQGRPHWGKIHYLKREDLAAVYPRLDDFTALRDRLDPTGVFSNSYTDGLFGGR